MLDGWLWTTRMVAAFLESVTIRLRHADSATHNSASRRAPGATVPARDQ